MTKQPGSAQDPLWYKDAIVYEAHVRAFFDSNGDGIGDFQGLTQKLDYLSDLGITAIWLLPFFYRLTPLADAALGERLLGLAERAGVPAIGVWVADQSRKSRTANAALAGLGPTRRILISDTMLAEYSDEEIEVVLAHELGHHVHGDIHKGLALQAVLILGAFVAAAILIDVSVGAFGLHGPSDAAGLPLLLLASQAPGDWPVYRGDPTMTGTVKDNLPAKLEVLWKFKTGDGIEGGAAIANGVVYVGSYDEHLYALNLADGTLKWKQKLGPIKAAPAVQGEVRGEVRDEGGLGATTLLVDERNPARQAPPPTWWPRGVPSHEPAERAQRSNHTPGLMLTHDRPGSKGKIA